MSLPKNDVAGLILTGGQSRRMHQHKATLEFNGRPLWKTAADILAPFVRDVLLVGVVPSLQSRTSLTLLDDDPPGYGPLGGIVTGLERSGYQHHLVLAVDYPLVRGPLLQLLLQRSTGVWAVCGRSKECLEPLVGYYHANCVPTIRTMLAEGEVRTHQLFRRVPSTVLTEKEYDKVDPQHLSRFNVNTPADLKRARQVQQALPINRSRKS